MRFSAVVPTQSTLRLTPGVLSAVDMCAAFTDQHFPMIDAVAFERCYIQAAVGGEAVGVDNRVQWHDGVDPASAPQDTEDRDLPGSTTASFSFAPASKVAFARVVHDP